MVSKAAKPAFTSEKGTPYAISPKSWKWKGKKGEGWKVKEGQGKVREEKGGYCRERKEGRDGGNVVDK